MQQPMINPKDIFDPKTAINMALVLMAKAFKLNYSTSTNNNQIISSNLCKRRIAQPGRNIGQDRQMQMVRGNGGNQFGQYNVGNQNGLIVVPGIANQNANQNGNGNVVAAQAKVNGNGNNRNQVRCYNYKGMGHLARNCTVRPRRRDAAYLQTQDLDQIKEVNANCILVANLQQALTSGTQTDKAPVYDSDGSAECGT
ncbi:gag-pol polyprotein [Tanacetum coccineum]